MSDNELHTGIFCRGVLLGYAKFEEQYRDKQGQIQVKAVHALGVSKTVKGRFGEVRESTQQILLSDQLLKNPAFMSSVRSSVGSMIEILLSGYSDFNNRPYVSNDAIIHVLPAPASLVG